MKPRLLSVGIAALVAIVGGVRSPAYAQAGAKASPPASVPTASLNNVARQGFFYAGGKYVGELGAARESTIGGVMYVEVMVPRQIRSPYPIVFLHGAGQTGVDWLQTPDGRPGWAYNFLDLGYVVYLQDFPTRGRSQYVPGVDGTADRLNLNIRTAPNLEETFTASAARGDFPQAKKHTAWPGRGRIGDKIFDDFARSQVQFLAGGRQETLTRDANVALLDMIGTPVILLTHSQGGAFGWLIADARPNLVKAIVTAEPAAPPIRGVDTAKVAYNDGGGLSWGVANSPITYEPAATAPSDLQTVLDEKPAPGKVACYVQREPARTLKNLRNIPVLFLNGEGGYHRVYDHCLAKWLNQAGVKTEYIEMETVGLAGNGHMMMLEKNSAEIAKYIGSWLTRAISQTAKDARPDVSKAMPPKAIPTFSTDAIARKGFFYAGGKYWGDPGKEVMRGAMYTEVLVPKQIRQPNPIVIFHGNGQTGVDWLQTPDGRAGWAYYLVQQGYVVYMVDYPARGRSAFVPLPRPRRQDADRRQSEHSHRPGARTHLDERTRARRFPAEDEPHPVARDGKDRRPDLRRLRQDPGPIRRRQPAARDRRGRRLTRYDRCAGDPADPLARRRHRVRRDRGPSAVGQGDGNGRARGAADWQCQHRHCCRRSEESEFVGAHHEKIEYDPPAAQPADLNVYLEEKQERPDEARCWLQVEPARKLARWKNIRVLDISANGTYHRTYDPCIPKWLNQAGVKTDFVRLETVGITGNSHMMMLEKNSDDVIKFIVSWIQKNTTT